MKIIFLDIDGVVNTLMIYNKKDKNRKRRSKDGFFFELNSPDDGRVSNEQAIMWLNKLCIETEASIVISSTWRICENGLENTKKALYNSGLFKSIPIIGETPRLSGEKRGTEIKKWLNDNFKSDWPDFIILDDDSDMLDLTPQLIKCDTYVGMTFNQYRDGYYKLAK